MNQGDGARKDDDDATVLFCSLRRCGSKVVVLESGLHQHVWQAWQMAGWDYEGWVAWRGVRGCLFQMGSIACVVRRRLYVGRGRSSRNRRSLTRRIIGVNNQSNYRLWYL